MFARWWVMCTGSLSIHKPSYSLLAISHLVLVKWQESKRRNIHTGQVHHQSTHHSRNIHYMGSSVCVVAPLHIAVMLCSNFLNRVNTLRIALVKVRIRLWTLCSRTVCKMYFLTNFLRTKRKWRTNCELSFVPHSTLPTPCDAGTIVSLVACHISHIRCCM